MNRLPYLVNAPIKLQDGVEISVQASQMHYSMPKENFAPAYSKVEIGYFNDGNEGDVHVDPLLAPYSVKSDSRICAFVPVAVLRELVIKHGGIHKDSEIDLNDLHLED